MINYVDSASGIYKRRMSVPTKENTLPLATVDVGGKNTQEQGQIKDWAVPATGPDVSITPPRYWRVS